jgi:hypothetical protein
MLTSTPPDASKFRVFGCNVFAKGPDNLRRKLGYPFHGVMVSYPHDIPGYRIYNPATRRITTSVHVVFQETTPGFGAHQPIDSVITNASDADDPPNNNSPKFHLLALDTVATPNTHHPLEADRPPHLMSHPIRYGELVAHLSDHPPALVTACCDPYQGKAKEDIFEQPSVSSLIYGPHHHLAGAEPDAIVLLSTPDCVGPKS